MDCFQLSLRNVIIGGTSGSEMKILEREDSREILECALREARSGEGRVAFIAGEAGIGKTTLVESFVCARVGRDCVLWEHCEVLSPTRPPRRP